MDGFDVGVCPRLLSPHRGYRLLPVRRVRGHEGGFGYGGLELGGCPALSPHRGYRFSPVRRVRGHEGGFGYGGLELGVCPASWHPIVGIGFHRYDEEGSTKGALAKDGLDVGVCLTPCHPTMGTGFHR